MRHALLLLLLVQISATAEVIERQYQGFTIWLDCDRRGAVEFHYFLEVDRANLPRDNRFYLDSATPDDCQQFSNKTYKRKKGLQTYDRGHLVPANHMDNDAIAITQSNHMTNVLPQVSTMNRGAWLATEEISECYRDLGRIEIRGGVVWGNDPRDDYFLVSHGVATPDSFWKVLIRDSGDSIAWIIPNNKEARRAMLNEYIASIAEIEAAIGYPLALNSSAKQVKAKVSWQLPKGCDKS